MEKLSGKINVLLLVPTFDVGGTGNAVFTLANSLNPNKFNPVICSMRKPDLRAEERAKECGIMVIKLNMRSFFDISVISKLSRILKREEIDILHNHGFRPEIYGGLAGRIAKCKGILATILHNPAQDIPLDYGFVIGNIMNLLRRIFAFFCEDVLVAISEDAKKGLLKLHFSSKKIKVIYSGINHNLLQQNKNHFNRKNTLAKFGIISDKFIIGTISVLKPRKGLSYLINAAKIVAQECPEINFLIIGSGSLEKELKEKVKSSGLQKHIVFQNYIKQISEFYKSIDLFVLPSLTEGIPAVLLEAMAFGVPVVATRVGGVPEMIEDGISGILVPPQNPEALAEAIIKIYKNPNLASIMAKNARARFEKYFTANTMARQYEKVYEELLKT